MIFSSGSNLRNAAATLQGMKAGTTQRFLEESCPSYMWDARSAQTYQQYQPLIDALSAELTEKNKPLLRTWGRRLGGLSSVQPGGSLGNLESFFKDAPVAQFKPLSHFEIADIIEKLNLNRPSSSRPFTMVDVPMLVGKSWFSASRNLLYLYPASIAHPLWLFLQKPPLAERISRSLFGSPSHAAAPSLDARVDVYLQRATSWFGLLHNALNLFKQL